MSYLVEKVFKVWSEFIFNFVKLVLRFKDGNAKYLTVVIQPILLFLGEEYLRKTHPRGRNEKKGNEANSSKIF